MIRLLNKETKRLIGTIVEADLDTLVDLLEEEDAEDTDYYLTPGTIDMLEAQGASAQLVSMLKQALGKPEGIEIMWERS
jgi:hypothetical protein